MVLETWDVSLCVDVATSVVVIPHLLKARVASSSSVPTHGTGRSQVYSRLGLVRRHWSTSVIECDRRKIAHVAFDMSPLLSLLSGLISRMACSHPGALHFGCGSRNS